MRILVTNDDGIHAEGLRALERIAAELSDDVWTVAPEVEQSGASRAMTLTTPLRVRPVSERRFAVFGTPTDCVMLAFQDLIEGARAAAAIASNQEWRESRPAQFSCKEDELVARVREVLARHEVKWGN